MLYNKSSKSGLILLGGLTGITGVLITIISDFILLGRPVDAYTFFRIGTETMAGLADWRITVGTFLGVFIIPLQIAGLITIYYGLKPAGKFLSLSVVIPNAHGLIMAVAFHVSYAFIGSGWKLYYELGSDNPISSLMMKRFDYYWKIIIVIVSIELLFSSICFIIAVLKGNSLYPKWMALFNPVCIFALVFLLIFAIPAPVGGFIAPTYLNLSTLVFFILSTVTVYKKLLSFEKTCK